MALTSGLIGNSSPITTTTGYEILDAVYSNACVILEDVGEVFQGKFGKIPGLGFPLIGFSYKPEGGIELLKFRWSQYPYLNKAKLTFAAVKEATDFSVSVISPITPVSPLPVAQIQRATLVALLNKYVSRGGKFTVMTLWGTKTHCVMTSLTGISEDKVMDGTLFKMDFNQPNYDLSGADESMSSFMQRVTKGAAV